MSAYAWPPKPLEPPWPPIHPFIDSAGVLRPTPSELVAAQRVRNEDL